MSPLKNQRRERLAQELAQGKSATGAMEAAGYSDPRNSTRLTKNDEIRGRISELQRGGAEQAEITIASLVDEFDEARQLALANAQASAAVSATLGKAKITGMVVDRAEVGKPGAFD